MTKFYLYLFLCFFSLVWSQNDSILKGKIVSESNNLEGIHIINLNSKFVSITDERGYFSIKVALNDTLMFSAVHLKGLKIVVNEDVFSKDLYFVPMEISNFQLREITLINYRHINPEALGIVPVGQKRYTPAEKKLKTASDLNGQFGLNTVMSLDPLFNWISGRTTMLKKELEVERKEILQDKTTDNYSKSYIINTLKIPEEYVDGFLFYIVEDLDYTNAMNAKNYTQASFLIVKLATDYKALITSKPEINNKNTDEESNKK